MAIIQITVEDNVRSLQADSSAWASAHAGTNKSINTYWDTPYGYIQMGSWLSGGTHHIIKGMLRFPLTDSLIIGATINTAKLYFYTHTAEGNASKMFVTRGYQSIPVVVGDWDNNMAQTGILGSRWADITLGAWNSVTLDAAGVNYILANIGGAVQFCIRSQSDYYNESPSSVYSTFWNTYGTEHGSLEWYLELDYVGSGLNRVTGIRHIYRPGSYRAELTLGDVSLTSEVVKQGVVLPPPEGKVSAKETEAARTVFVPEKTVPELIEAIRIDRIEEEDLFPASAKITMAQPYQGLGTPAPKPPKPPTGAELAARAESYLQAAGQAPSYPQTRTLWERFTPWDERKGETFGGEIRERVEAARKWFSESWLGQHLGGGMN